MRLIEAQSAVGSALGGEAGAKLLARLAMPLSPATIVRRIRSQKAASPTTLRIVGVDDWAIRRGQTYVTILVDLARRRVVEVLKDRTSETLAAWL